MFWARLSLYYNALDVLKGIQAGLYKHLSIGGFIKASRYGGLYIASRYDGLYIASRYGGLVGGGVAF